MTFLFEICLNPSVLFETCTYALQIEQRYEGPITYASVTRFLPGFEDFVNRDPALRGVVDALLTNSPVIPHILEIPTGELRTGVEGERVVAMLVSVVDFVSVGLVYRGADLVDAAFHVTPS